MGNGTVKPQWRFEEESRGGFICLFCGGASCKRENWKLQKEPGAIQGLHSSWITGDIIGMQRPSSRLIHEFNILSQFQKLGIGAIMNVQEPGEHPNCGDGNQEGGFSYRPEEFMDAGVFFYNFGWVDMTVPTLELMMRIVQVVSFTVVEKHKKVAVHCHAGLGRTGLVIACWLIYEHKISTDQAVALVRTSRPGSIQTSAQLEFCQQFELWVCQLRQVYVLPPALPGSLFSFAQHLTAQRAVLHGGELRQRLHVPKIVSLLCDRLRTAVESHGASLVAMSFIDVGPSWSQADEANLTALKRRFNMHDWLGLETGSEGGAGSTFTIGGSGAGAIMGSHSAGISDVRYLAQLLLDWFDHLESSLLPRACVDMLCGFSTALASSAHHDVGQHPQQLESMSSSLSSPGRAAVTPVVAGKSVDDDAERRAAALNAHLDADTHATLDAVVQLLSLFRHCRPLLRERVHARWALALTHAATPAVMRLMRVLHPIAANTFINSVTDVTTTVSSSSISTPPRPARSANLVSVSPASAMKTALTSRSPASQLSSTSSTAATTRAASPSQLSKADPSHQHHAEIDEDDIEEDQADTEAADPENHFIHAHPNRSHYSLARSYFALDAAFLASAANSQLLTPRPVPASSFTFEPNTPRKDSSTSAFSSPSPSPIDLKDALVADLPSLAPVPSTYTSILENLPPRDSSSSAPTSNLSSATASSSSSSAGDSGRANTPPQKKGIGSLAAYMPPIVAAHPTSTSSASSSSTTPPAVDPSSSASTASAPASVSLPAATVTTSASKSGDKVVMLTNTSSTVATQELGIASASSLARAPLGRTLAKEASSLSLTNQQPAGSAALSALPLPTNTSGSASMSSFSLASFSVNDTLDGSKDLAARLHAAAAANNQASAITASPIDEEESSILTARFPPMALLGTRPAQLPPISHQKKLAGLTVNASSGPSMASSSSGAPVSSGGAIVDLSASLADESFVFPEQPVEPDGQALMTSAAMPSAAAMLMGPITAPQQQQQPGEAGTNSNSGGPRGRSRSVDDGSNPGGSSTASNPMRISYGSSALNAIDPASALAAWSSSVQVASSHPKDASATRSRPSSNTSSHQNSQRSTAATTSSSPVSSSSSAVAVIEPDAPLPLLELASSPLVRPSSGRSTLSTASGVSFSSASIVRASPHLAAQPSSSTASLLTVGHSVAHLSLFHQRQLNRNLAPGVPRTCALARLTSALSALVLEWDVVADDFAQQQRQKLPMMGRLAPGWRPRPSQSAQQAAAASVAASPLTSPTRPAAGIMLSHTSASSSSSSSSSAAPTSDSGWETAVESRALELLATLSSDRRAQLLQRVLAAQADQQQY